MNRLIFNFYNNVLRIPITESPSIDLDNDEENENSISINRNFPRTTNLLEDVSSYPLKVKSLTQNITHMRLQKSLGLKPSYAKAQHMKDSINHFLGIRQPKIFKHTPIDFPRNTDKLFCSTWLNNDIIVVGGKDNRMHLLDCRKGYQGTISTPTRVNLMTYDIDGKISEKNGMPATEAELSECQTCGYHTLELSPGGNILATTGELAQDICLYDAKTMDPIYNIEGNKDWVFDMKFLNEEYLVSGSRDKMLGIWKFKEDGSLKNGALISTLNMIRHLQVDPKQKMIYALSNDGTMSKFDLQHSHDAVNRFVLPYPSETVTMAFQSQTKIMAVGGRVEVMFIDFRIKDKKVKVMENQQQSWGLRSMSWNDSGNILTMAGGLGRILFYDLRADKFIPVDNDVPSRDNIYIKAEGGYVRRDNTYYSIYDVLGLSIPTAIYTHCYSPDNSKIFMAGGPTQFGLVGTYAGLLHL